MEPLSPETIIRACQKNQLTPSRLKNLEKEKNIAFPLKQIPASPSRLIDFKKQLPPVGPNCQE
jgi:hypothetical protein